MKSTGYPFFLLLIFGIAFCNADTWTSVKGQKLEGAFIDYNAQAETITIKRASDGKFFTIPEDQITHADRIKAIKLKNENIAPYWYTDYQKAKAENPDKRCLVLYRNGSPAEAVRIILRQIAVAGKLWQIAEKPRPYRLHPRNSSRRNRAGDSLE